MKRYYKWLIFLGATLLLFILAIYEVEPEAEMLFTLYLLGLFIWAIYELRSLIKARNEQSRTEIRHLQSQVNPHFFFNTLNNLYGLVGSDPQRAQRLILHLADMMRYSIYEGQKTVVPLEDEVDYLRQYIELHQMRYHKKIKVLFTENIGTEHIEVMPLLFIILLENAFKHGVENLRSGAFVSVDLEASKRKIKFDVINNFDPEQPAYPPGIGLMNLKKRLELVYPNRHEFTSRKSGEIYETQLTLYLK